MVNEDRILWLNSTGGQFKIYPSDGLWTVAGTEDPTPGSDAPQIVVGGLDSFAIALDLALKGLHHNPEAILESERTLKDRVVAGLDGPMMDEYLTKALEAGDGI